MSRSTRHRKILDLRNVFCQRGSFCESVTLQSLRTADHDCVHFILVSCTLLMFRHGLMIQPQLSWAVELKHVSITKQKKLGVILMTSITSNTVKVFPNGLRRLNLLLKEEEDF